MRSMQLYMLISNFRCLCRFPFIKVIVIQGAYRLNAAWGQITKIFQTFKENQ